jgi:hypothetical protein
MFTANQVTFKTAKRCEVLTEVNYEVYLSSGMSHCELQETGTNNVVGTASSMSLSYSEDEAVTSLYIYQMYYIPGNSNLC